MKLIRNLLTKNVVWDCEIINDFEEKVKIFNSVRDRLSRCSMGKLVESDFGISEVYSNVLDNVILMSIVTLGQEIKIMYTEDYKLIKFEAISSVLPLVEVIINKFIEKQNEKNPSSSQVQELIQKLKEQK